MDVDTVAPNTNEGVDEAKAEGAAATASTPLHPADASPLRCVVRSLQYTESWLAAAVRGTAGLERHATYVVEKVGKLKWGDNPPWQEGLAVSLALSVARRSTETLLMAVIPIPTCVLRAAREVVTVAPVEIVCRGLLLDRMRSNPQPPLLCFGSVFDGVDVLAIMDVMNKWCDPLVADVVSGGVGRGWTLEMVAVKTRDHLYQDVMVFFKDVSHSRAWKALVSGMDGLPTVFNQVPVFMFASAGGGVASGSVEIETACEAWRATATMPAVHPVTPRPVSPML